MKHQTTPPPPYQKQGRIQQRKTHHQPRLLGLRRIEVHQKLGLTIPPLHQKQGRSQQRTPTTYPPFPIASTSQDSQQRHIVINPQRALKNASKRLESIRRIDNLPYPLTTPITSTHSEHATHHGNVGKGSTTFINLLYLLRLREMRRRKHTHQTAQEPE